MLLLSIFILIICELYDFNVKGFNVEIMEYIKMGKKGKGVGISEGISCEVKGVKKVKGLGLTLLYLIVYVFVFGLLFIYL